MATKAEIRDQVREVIKESSELGYQNSWTARLLHLEEVLSYLRYAQLVDLRRSARRWLQEAKDQHTRFEGMVRSAELVAVGAIDS